jgi:hypothetical protein
VGLCPLSASDRRVCRNWRPLAGVRSFAVIAPHCSESDQIHDQIHVISASKTGGQFAATTGHCSASKTGQFAATTGHCSVSKTREFAAMTGHCSVSKKREFAAMTGHCSGHILCFHCTSLFGVRALLSLHALIVHYQALCYRCLPLFGVKRNSLLPLHAIPSALDPLLSLRPIIQSQAPTYPFPTIVNCQAFFAGCPSLIGARSFAVACHEASPPRLCRKFAPNNEAVGAETKRPEIP